MEGKWFNNDWKWFNIQTSQQESIIVDESIKKADKVIDPKSYNNTTTKKINLVQK